MFNLRLNAVAIITIKLVFPVTAIVISVPADKIIVSGFNCQMTSKLGGSSL